MAESEKSILAVLCMIYDDNKLLLQDRVKRDWRGLAFPGGHVEKGESFVKAIIREIKEETGLTIYNPQLCGIKQFPTENGERYVVLLFKTNQFSGKLCSSHEGEMIWVNRDDLKNSPVVEGFFEVLRICDDKHRTELFYEYNNEKNEWISELY
ncbi:MAG: 8-oxo-dGTP diphosphatase [Sporomusa sp.]